MYGALPPGAWWDNINKGTRAPRAEPYGPSAGDAAVRAAQSGALQLSDLYFSYPLRPNVEGCPPYASLVRAVAAPALPLSVQFCTANP